MRNDGDALAAVEHAVACAAIADAATEQLAFARKQAGLLGARAEDDVLRFNEVSAERESKRTAHRNNLVDDARARLCAQSDRLIPHGV